MSSDLTAQMQRTLATTAPSLAISGFYRMNDLLAHTLATQRIEVALLSVMAALALSLSAIGISALVANLVLQRTREIGIRIALGSTIRQAMLHIGSSGLIASTVGLLAGLGLSAAALRARHLRSRNPRRRHRNTGRRHVARHNHPHPAHHPHRPRPHSPRRVIVTRKSVAFRATSIAKQVPWPSAVRRIFARRETINQEVLREFFLRTIVLWLRALRSYDRPRGYVRTKLGFPACAGCFYCRSGPPEHDGSVRHQGAATWAQR